MGPAEVPNEQGAGRVECRATCYLTVNTILARLRADHVAQWCWAGWWPGTSVLLVPSLPPGVDELPEEQLAAQGTPGVFGVAATAGEAVGVYHTIVGQGVDLEAQG